mgnify:CR=1 FL=1
MLPLGQREYLMSVPPPGAAATLLSAALDVNMHMSCSLGTLLLL